MKKLTIFAICLTSYIMLNGLAFNIDFGFSQFVGSDVDNTYQGKGGMGFGASHSISIAKGIALEPGGRILWLHDGYINKSPRINYNYQLFYYEPFVKVRYRANNVFMPTLYAGVGFPILGSASIEADYKDDKDLNYKESVTQQFNTMNYSALLGFEYLYEGMGLRFEYFRTLNTIKKETEAMNDVYLQSFFVSLVLTWDLFFLHQ